MVGDVIIQRLHRMVRHGFRPWLGYDVASGQDRDIHLRRKDMMATLLPDGTVRFTVPVPLANGTSATEIPGGDHESFDAFLAPNTRNKRNLMRRLYEIGL